MPNPSDTANNAHAHLGRRKHRRHVIAIQATAYSHEADKVNATISNISYEGLQLSLAKLSAEKLLRPSINSEEHQHTRLAVEFFVDNQQQQLSLIHILCRVVHLEILQDQCLIGLEYRDIEEGIMALSEFIMAQPDSHSNDYL